MTGILAAVTGLALTLSQAGDAELRSSGDRPHDRGHHGDRHRHVEPDPIIIFPPVFFRRPLPLLGRPGVIYEPVIPSPWPPLGYGWWTPPVVPFDPGYVPAPEWGWNVPHPAAAQPIVPRVEPQPAGPAEPPAEEPEPRPARGSNAQSIALARRLISTGDDFFVRKNYAQASQQYRNAGRTSPVLADAFMRQGFVGVAMGNYPAAAKAFKRGLELDAESARSGFHLDRLYGENQAEKRKAIDALAAASASQLDNGELLFVLGVMLHFDGQAARAVPFFQRAVQLGGVDAPLVRGFLGEPQT